MPKDINLTSQEWNDIIFDGKNKEYGAYEMRMSSSKRLSIAFLISIGIVVFVALLPSLVATVNSWRPAPENLSESSFITDLSDPDQNKVDEIVPDTKEPEPEYMETVQFTAPDIVDQVDATHEMKSQTDLSSTDIRISVADVAGNSETGIDIAELDKHAQISEEKKEVIHDIVEQRPEYPGGEKALMQYLSDNLKYPQVARETGIEGKVHIRFVVSKTGEISNVQVRRAPHPSLGEEGVRVVKSMPKWIPGKQNGKAVNVYFTLPIDFVLTK